MESATTMKITDKKELVKLLSYIVMGDGGLYVTKECTNAKFIMNMVEENEDYINFCKGILENLTGCKVYPKVCSSEGGNRKPQLTLVSKTHPELTKIRDRIYTGSYKGIDPHALKLLDFQALAILYMCDGCLVVDKADSESGKKKGLKHDSFNVTLNLKRLSYGDLFILKKALKEKLDLEWNINRQNKYYYLRLRTKDVDKFMEGVAPFVVPSFQRKIKDNFRMVSPF